MKNKIVAGIVLYNPNLTELKRSIEIIVPQVNKIIFYDNGSKNINVLKEMLRHMSIKYLIIESSKNTGIAHALNSIAKLSLKKNFHWLLTLDQDSILRPNLVEEYLKYLDLPNVGQLSCNFIDRNTGDVEYTQYSRKKYYEIDKCITSGTLINLIALKEIGGFDEKLFIDYVDFDVSFALRKKGYKNYRINFIGMSHTIGERKKYKIGFKIIDVMNHSSFRHFFITRNELIIYKRYSNEKLPNMYRIQINTLIKIILFEQNKKEKINSVIHGIFSAQRNKYIRKRYI